MVKEFYDVFARSKIDFSIMWAIDRIFIVRTAGVHESYQHLQSFLQRFLR